MVVVVVAGCFFLGFFISLVLSFKQIVAIAFHPNLSLPGRCKSGERQIQKNTAHSVIVERSKDCELIK